MARAPQPAIVRHHVEWTSLVDSFGPYLSPFVLSEVFPQGLDADETIARAELRLAYEEWLLGVETDEREEVHELWVQFVLERLLGHSEADLTNDGAVRDGFCVHFAAQSVTLAPDFVIHDPREPYDPFRARILVSVVPPDQGVERAVKGGAGSETPLSRMIGLVHGNADRGVNLGLLTNGEEWTLVHCAPEATTSHATWLAGLWLDEPLTCQGFVTLLRPRRLFGVAEENRLEALFERSAQHRHDDIDQLGMQVRRAVEMLTHTIDRIDRERGGELLSGVSEDELYEAVLSVMMRLVFLLYAEDHEPPLFPVERGLYAESYAVSTMLAELQSTADRSGEEVLEHRHEAWARLCATFRVIHGGVDHDELFVPAYGGRLFDPDRFPFLEGRKFGTRWQDAIANPLPIDDRTVLSVLRSLQFLEGGRGQGARRLSFRAIGVEQIGHVYETLLDHTAVRAEEPVLGLIGQPGEDPEVRLSELEAWSADGIDGFVRSFRRATGRTEKQVRGALDTDVDLSDGGWIAACAGDMSLLDRVRPFAGLVRPDAFGRPFVLPAGSVYVTEGTDRRSTGTHYTPPSLTEPIVRYTLEPLVFDGAAEGASPEEWTLKGPKEILGLRVCDMAVGSGAFLVQACRYMSERLVEAWARLESANPGKILVSPDGELSEGRVSERLIPDDPDERLVIARRAVAERCLFGVDRNPMAVDMAKMSLWLVTMQRGLPFEFFDHAIRHGDALLGVVAPDQLRVFHVNPDRGAALFSDRQLFDVESAVREAIERATDLRREINGIDVKDVRDADAKARLHAHAHAAVGRVRLIADLVTVSALAHAGQWSLIDDELKGFIPLVPDALGGGTESDSAGGGAFTQLKTRAGELLDRGMPERRLSRVPFHWPLEFPDVLARSDAGFDAFVGNPPFQGGQRITGEHGTDYRDYLVEHVANGRRGSADLSAYFFLRARRLLKTGGRFGFLATNTIAQGDTREVGLAQMVESGVVLTRAVQSRKWPGEANLEVAHVWGHNGEWRDGFVLDDAPVEGITTYLSRPGRVVGDPFRLKANEGKAFIGSYVLGTGFILEPEEAQALIDCHARNREVLFPYLTGEDLNSRPDQSPSRWVINFHDWPLDRSAKGSWQEATARERRGLLRDGRVPQDYVDPVAADYPECLEIVSERVRPQRMEQNDARGQKYWWRFLRTRNELYERVHNSRFGLVRARVSSFHAISLLRGELIMSEQTVVFPIDSLCRFSVLQSTAHIIWLERRSSTHETRTRYTPSDCLETFPFPNSDEALVAVGKRYYDARQELLQRYNCGLTALYRRFHDANDEATDLESFRVLHAQMDDCVLAAYGWDDLDLTYGFRETPRGSRYTVSASAEQEIYDRLLALNHRRHAEEEDEYSETSESPTIEAEPDEVSQQLGLDL